VFILELGFICCNVNKCVYIHYSSKDKCILELHINITRYLIVIKYFKAEFIAKFDIKDLGPMKLLLSIQVSQQKEKVAIFQAIYIRSIIAIFALKDNLSNSMLILERDYDNIIKTVREKNPHPPIDKYLY
jgi:Reverse transcriptase (RNA-dependent DNA polymerase)